VRVLAPAKVNLLLRVGARRADGYHELDTLFQAIDLADELEVAAVPGAGMALEVEGEAGPDADNLALRAARAFLSAAGMGPQAQGVRLRLVKRVPVGAGLGGGSSDAAAALRALDHLFPGVLDGERLARIAEGLGSDVPFFLGSSPLARGRCRGERLEPLPPLPVAAGVVVMPPARVSTTAAYAALDRWRGEGGGPAGGGEPITPDGWSALGAAVNDFEEVIAAELPAVARALAALRRTDPLLALLSGSGAACFAIHASAGRAERAAASAEMAEVGRACRFRTLSAWPGVAEVQP